MRSAKVTRNTLETQISVELDLDGSGKASFATGLPFLDHMLDQVARHGLLDIGIAVDHFTLQAAELGIGTCWLGWFNARAVCRALNLPRSTRLDAMLSVGYPTTPADRVSGRKPPAEIWSFNRD